MTKRRPRCRYRLDYLGRPLCRAAWKRDLMAEAKHIPLGCPEDCPDYQADIYEVGSLEAPIEQEYDDAAAGKTPAKE